MGAFSPLFLFFFSSTLNRERGCCQRVNTTWDVLHSPPVSVRVVSSRRSSSARRRSKRFQFVMMVNDKKTSQSEGSLFVFFSSARTFNFGRRRRRPRLDGEVVVCRCHRGRKEFFFLSCHRHHFSDQSVAAARQPRIGNEETGRRPIRASHSLSSLFSVSSQSIGG